MAKISIIGAGAWGTAIASHSARMGHDVRLWAYESSVVEEINRSHRNSTYLAGVDLPASIRATSVLTECASGADVLVFVSPAQHFRRITSEIASKVDDRTLLVVASKGIEESSLKLLSVVALEVFSNLKPERLAFLSGPSFAAEVARGLPTNLVAASTSAETVHRLQELFHSDVFRVYKSNDVVGVQVGGAIKNVIAVAAGACDGLELGSNARAALVTRGLAEITRLGVAMGGSPLTFLGLAGAGDLFLTCAGQLSRNRSLGIALAQGIKPEEFLRSSKAVAEGFHTSAAAYALSQRFHVDMPITEQVYYVLHEGRPLREAMQMLLTREFKGEL